MKYTQNEKIMQITENTLIASSIFRFFLKKTHHHIADENVFNLNSGPPLTWSLAPMFPWGQRATQLRFSGPSR